MIHECLKPLKLTAAPRVALCRTELIDQLYTQHGFHDGFVLFCIFVLSSPFPPLLPLPVMPSYFKPVQSSFLVLCFGSIDLDCLYLLQQQIHVVVCIFFGFAPAL